MERKLWPSSTSVRSNSSGISSSKERRSSASICLPRASIHLLSKPENMPSVFLFLYMIRSPICCAGKHNLEHNKGDNTEQDYRHNPCEKRCLGRTNLNFGMSAVIITLLH